MGLEIEVAIRRENRNWINEKNVIAVRSKPSDLSFVSEFTTVEYFTLTRAATSLLLSSKKIGVSI